MNVKSKTCPQTATKQRKSGYKTSDELIAIPLPIDPDGTQFFRFRFSVSEP